VSQPPYPYGNPQDPASQPPSDPYQQAGYPPPFPDPAYPDPAYQQATYPVPSQFPPTQPYQGYPTYPPAPPPPPRRGATVAIVTVVALLLVLVVGGGIAAAYLIPKGKPSAQNSQSPAPATSTTPSTAPSSSPTPDAGPTHGADLRGYLVAMPDGAKKCPNEEGTDNALNLNQAAQLSSDPAKRSAELQQFKFTGGAVRCWVLDNKTVVDVRLYQFNSSANASGFFDADIRGTKPGYSTDNITTVSGVPGAQSFASPNKDSNGYARVISIGQRGDVVLVVALAQIPPVKVSVAEDLLVQQYQKL
jgi:hypothetical protein